MERVGVSEGEERKSSRERRPKRTNRRVMFRDGNASRPRRSAASRRFSGGLVVDHDTRGKHRTRRSADGGKAFVHSRRAAMSCACASRALVAFASRCSPGIASGRASPRAPRLRRWAHRAPNPRDRGVGTASAAAASAVDRLELEGMSDAAVRDLVPRCGATISSRRRAPSLRSHCVHELRSGLAVA